MTRLALQARRGDEAALTGFVQRTQADVWRLAAHLVDRASADDLTQETYLRAVPALGRYRADAPARTWLLAIARRACADELRSVGGRILFMDGNAYLNRPGPRLVDAAEIIAAWLRGEAVPSGAGVEGP